MTELNVDTILNAANIQLLEDGTYAMQYFVNSD